MQTTDPPQIEALAGALQAVPGKLPPTEAQQIFAHLTDAFTHTADPSQFFAPAEALKLVTAKLPSTETQQIFALLTAALAHTTDPFQLNTLAGALQAVPGKLPPTEAQQIFAHLTDAFAYTPNGFQLDVLAGVLKAVPIQLDRQQLINFLKWPSSVGVVRSTFLDMLEQQTGQKFDGNLWKMVTWAQAHGLDVKNLPIEALWQTNQPPPDWLGIQIKPSTEPPGLFVEKVITERSAAQAGIQPHDVIVRFNAHEVHDPETLFRLVGVAAIGTTVDVDIIHDGQRRTIRVTLGKRPVSRP